GMHRVLFDFFRANRLKGTEADVEREFAGFDPSIANALESFRREMQPSRRRSNRSAPLGENRLIALAVGCFVVALNVRRKRDVPQAIKQFVDGFLSLRSKPQRAQTQFPARQDFRFQHSLSKQNPLADGELAAGANQGFPRVGLDLLRQQDLYVAG